MDGDFGCSGFVELHKEGLWGAVADSPGVSPALATRICQALGCGTAIDGHGYAKPERESHLPVRWEAAEPCESHLLLDCFNGTSARRGKTPAFIICSGESSPRHSPCSFPGPLADRLSCPRLCSGAAGWFSPCRDARLRVGGAAEAPSRATGPIPACPTHPGHPLLLFLSCVRRQNRKSPRRARSVPGSGTPPTQQRCE